MPTPVDAPETLNREYLEIRAKILQLAASFDRLDRGAESVEADPRMQLIRQGLEILRAGKKECRAEQVQLLFSRPYDEAWREKYFSEGKQ